MSTSGIRTVLIVEDSKDGCRMLSEAIAQSGTLVDVHCVKDFFSLLSYLNRQDEYGDAKIHPSPNLILLDMDSNPVEGMETLRKIKSHPDLRRIPVVAMTSKKDRSVSDVYEEGANSYVDKPATILEFANSFKTIYQYWFENVELPTVR